MAGLGFRDDLGLRSTFLAGANGDSRPVRVVGTDKNAAISDQLLEANPNIRLQVLDQMPDMNWTVGVRQRGGDQNLSRPRFWGGGLVRCFGFAGSHRVSEALKCPIAFLQAPRRSFEAGRIVSVSIVFWMPTPEAGRMHALC